MAISQQIVRHDLEAYKEATKVLLLGVLCASLVDDCSLVPSEEWYVLRTLS